MWGTKPPKKSCGRYLVTLRTDFGNQVRQAEYKGLTLNGNPYWIILPSCSVVTSDVIAWMKEPAPYQPK